MFRRRTRRLLRSRRLAARPLTSTGMLVPAPGCVRARPRPRPWFLAALPSSLQSVSRRVIGVGRSAWSGLAGISTGDRPLPRWLVDRLRVVAARVPHQLAALGERHRSSRCTTCPRAETKRRCATSTCSVGSPCPSASLGSCTPSSKGRRVRLSAVVLGAVAVGVGSLVAFGVIEALLHAADGAVSGSSGRASSQVRTR